MKKGEFIRKIGGYKKLQESIYVKPKQNRNDKCDCGSGKKYKKCCMLDEMELLSTCCGAGGLGNIHEFQDEHYGLCGKCKDHADFKYEEM